MREPTLSLRFPFQSCLGAGHALLVFSLRYSVRTSAHQFCQPERIVKDFLYSWGNIWSPEISWRCVKPPSPVHTIVNPFNLIFKYWKICLNTKLCWRQKEPDIVCKDKLFSPFGNLSISEKCYLREYLLLSHIEPLQAAWCPTALHRRGRQCFEGRGVRSAREGTVSKSSGPWGLWTFDRSAQGKVNWKIKNVLRDWRVLLSGWQGTGVAQNLSEQWQRQTVVTECPRLAPSRFLLRAVPFQSGQRQPEALLASPREACVTT